MWYVLQNTKANSALMYMYVFTWKEAQTEENVFFFHTPFLTTTNGGNWQ